VKRVEKQVIISVNSSTTGSTGKIMFEIAEGARENGFLYYTASAVHGNESRITRKDHIYIGNKLEKKIHLILAKNLGLNGMLSQVGTFLFLKKLDRIQPDLIHLHNLHNCYINIPMLFQYIAKNNIPVLWTLHDCWSFTGHCPYFDLVNCDKWMSQCGDCPQYKEYPYSRFDNTSAMYQRKKVWFSNKNIKLIVTPSQWLADLVKKSYLKNHSVKVIHNGINLSVFRPSESDVRATYGLGDKKLVLGVANVWEKRKGYEDFLQLNRILGDKYQIILIGVEPNKEQDGIVRIKRTENQKRLAEFYSAADVFVNPTYEEVFGMVNVEALACGTPVITYDSGGSPESIVSGVGLTVPKGNVQKLAEAVVKLCCENKPVEACAQRAYIFSKETEVENYLMAYREILHDVKK
jgi:glycosyltransferase involved in cell wall biosynthesis